MTLSINAKDAIDVISVGEPEQQMGTWKVDQLASQLATKLRGRDFERGRAIFAQAHCIDCHRIAAAGGAVGPDLTRIVERRSFREVVESILEPNNIISDEYAFVNIETISGRIISGRIARSDTTVVELRTNALNPSAIEIINRQELAHLTRSKVSAMPTGLLNLFREEEILDLLAFVLSGGERGSTMYER